MLKSQPCLSDLSYCAYDYIFRNNDIKLLKGYYNEWKANRIKINGKIYLNSYLYYFMCIGTIKMFWFKIIITKIILVK